MAKKRKSSYQCLDLFLYIIISLEVMIAIILVTLFLVIKYPSIIASTNTPTPNQPQDPVKVDEPTVTPIVGQPPVPPTDTPIPNQPQDPVKVDEPTVTPIVGQPPVFPTDTPIPNQPQDPVKVDEPTVTPIVGQPPVFPTDIPIPPFSNWHKLPPEDISSEIKKVSWSISMMDYCLPEIGISIQLGETVYISCKGQPNELIQVTITLPNGQIKSQEVTADSSGWIDFFYSFNSNDLTGRYTFLFEGGGEPKLVVVNVQDTTNPRLYADRDGQLHLYHFRPNEHIRLFTYNKNNQKLEFDAWQDVWVNGEGQLNIQFTDQESIKVYTYVAIGDVSGEIVNINVNRPWDRPDKSIQLVDYVIANPGNLYLEVKAEPNVSSFTIIQVSPTVSMKVIDSKWENMGTLWWQVRLNDGIEGWILDKQVQRVIEPTVELSPTPVATSEPITPTVEPTSTPFISCSSPTYYQNIWQAHPELGCPISSFTSNFSIQYFEGGGLVWQEGPDRLIYALFYDGYWRSEPDPGGSATPSCLKATQTDGLGPIYGFGTLWCWNEDWQIQLGNPISGEYPSSNNQIQNFENGLIFTVEEAGTFILYWNGYWEVY